MSVINVNLEDSYRCKTIDQALSVDVAIGDGEDGDFSVFLGTDEKDPPVLGVKADVAGKKVTVIATVTETLTETKWTSITVTITEGTTKTDFGPYKKITPENFDTVVYSLQIYLS